jgi:hypothetical protein
VKTPQVAPGNRASVKRIICAQVILIRKIAMVHSVNKHLTAMGEGRPPIRSNALLEATFALVKVWP